MPIVSAKQSVTHDMHGARFTALANPSVGSRETCVWRVAVPPGAPAPTHQLTREEIFVVTGGAALVRIGDEEARRAEPGDVIVVPPNVDFRLEPLGDQAFEATVCFPVGGQARLQDGVQFTPPWAQ